MDEHETRVLAAPSRGSHVYGRLPHLPLLVAGLAALVGGLAVLALGGTTPGLSLLVLAAVLLTGFVHEATRSPASRLDDRVVAGRARTRALSGYAAASVLAWSGAMGRTTALRVRASRLARARQKAQFELGGAVYAQDAGRTAALLRRMRAIDGEVAACAAEAARAADGARTRLEQERLAVQRTEVNRTVP